MTRSAAVLLCGCLLGTAPDGPADDGPTYVNLQPRSNESLDANLGRGAAGNNLSELPRGERAFNGVKFKIEDRFIQLGSPLLRKKRPDKVEGIEVSGAFARLRILQGTFYGKGEKGGPLHVPDGTLIGRYVVHYEGGSTEEIPVVYGDDVRDWWITRGAGGVSRGEVAWEGDNACAKANGHRLRLYLGTWDNPKPSQRVTRIDFEKGSDTPAAPFCIALTLEPE